MNTKNQKQPPSRGCVGRIGGFTIYLFFMMSAVFIYLCYSAIIIYTLVGLCQSNDLVTYGSTVFLLLVISEVIKTQKLLLLRF